MTRCNGPSWRDLDSLDILPAIERPAHDIDAHAPAWVLRSATSSVPTVFSGVGNAEQHQRRGSRIAGDVPFASCHQDRLSHQDRLPRLDRVAAGIGLGDALGRQHATHPNESAATAGGGATGVQAGRPGTLLQTRARGRPRSIRTSSCPALSRKVMSRCSRTFAGPTFGAEPRLLFRGPMADAGQINAAGIPTVTYGVGPAGNFDRINPDTGKSGEQIRVADYLRLIGIYVDAA